jgi:hypothetical protein
MSETINRPEYYFTGIDFNSSFYVSNLPLEDAALLNSRYVQFPLAQNAPITFTATVRGLTAFLTENSTIIATTEWVQNYYNYVKTIANTWTGLQTFTLGMLTNTINPTTPSGTLIIGNTAVNTNVEISTQTGRTAILHLGDGTGATTSGGIHIGNGLASINAVNILYSSTDAGSSGIINLGAVNATTNLRCPLTPNYAALYPLGTGKIGYIQSSTVATLAVTPAIDQDLTSLTLDAGVWFLQFDAGISVAMSQPNYITLAINLTSATLTNARAGNNSIGQSTGSIANSNNSTSMAVSINASTTYYAVGISSLTGTYNWTNINFSATRIA